MNSVKIPDPGIRLGSDIWLRMEDLRESMQDRYVGRLICAMLLEQIRADLLTLNEQLESYGLPYQFTMTRTGPNDIFLMLTGWPENPMPMEPKGSLCLD